MGKNKNAKLFNISVSSQQRLIPFQLKLCSPKTIRQTVNIAKTNGHFDIQSAVA